MRGHVGSEIEHHLLHPLFVIIAARIVYCDSADCRGASGHILGCGHELQVDAQLPGVESGERNHGGVGQKQAAPLMGDI